MNLIRDACVPMGSYSKNVLSAIFYGLCSTSMAFINKAVVSSYGFDFPFFIMSCQMALSILTIEICRSFRYSKIARFSMSQCLSLFWASLFSAAHSVTSLHALSGMSIPMYAVIKRCTPLVTLVLSTVFLRKHMPSVDVVFSVLFITVGCVLAGIGDLQFHAVAYMYGAVSVLVQGLYLTFIQRCADSMSALQILYINSYNIFPVFSILCLVYESRELMEFQGIGDLGFISCFLMQVCVGLLLNFSLFLCTAENSALTTSIVGVMKSILQTIIGAFTFGGIIFNTLNLLGIAMNTIGGVLYTYIKYKKYVSSTIEIVSSSSPAKAV